MAMSGTQTTRFALNGTYTRLVGSFAGKTSETGSVVRIIMQMMSQYNGGQTAARVGKQ